jgi:hypothetical protein
VYVAPNVLSLAGLLCLMQGYYLCYMYMDVYPRLVTSAAFFLILCYQTLDAIAGMSTSRSAVPPDHRFDSIRCDSD